MQDRNARLNSPNRGDAEDRGVGSPVKVDSSSSSPPSGPDSPTVIEFPRVSRDGEAPFADTEATLVDPDATIAEGMPPPFVSARASVPRPTPSQVSTPQFEVGDVLGGRYEILQLLGEGGMGAVYKARDRELDRPVALKVIRPELASRSSTLARFKQELLLSRQVTHKNVIRIYDLGDADGVKFITMEFVEGRDLRSIIHEKQKLSPQESVDIMRQVCQALEAAHSVGVIHRDLKPQNIMQENSGRILVMDFGLARTLEGDGMTQTGALVGTLEYMSPEQALGKNLDPRSDLFTAGLILYEFLTGKMPYRAESALASLIKRTQERAIPVSDLDHTIPGRLSAVVSKCLERDPTLRYQTAAEMLRDLDTWQGKVAGATLGFHADVKPWGRTVPWPLLAGVLTVLILATVGYVFRAQVFTSPARQVSVGPQVSLAILPFRNASGDSSVDWLGPSLAEMLSTDVGQSARLRMISPEHLHQVLADLRITPGTPMDSTMIARVAEFSSADTVVWGQYAKFGDQIRVDATLRDLKHDRSVPLKIDNVSEKDIPGAVDHFAETIRQNLSVSPDILKELKASSFQPSSKSVAALREYNQGIQLMREGKNLEAATILQAAVKDDPEFALAYSQLAETDSALGYDSDAERNSRRAVELAQQLPLPEKYLIEASHARVVKDNNKAIEAYENLARSSPDNPDVRFALGSVYEDSGDMDKARASYEAVLKADPNNLNTLLAMGRVAIKSGDAQGGLDPLSRALNLAVKFDNGEQKALILLAMGIAYRALNKPDEALRDYQQSLEINRQLGQKRGVAANLMEIAQVQITLGKLDTAVASYRQALEIQRQMGTKKEIGDTLIDIGALDEQRGQYDTALDSYKQALQIERDAGDETYQALCLNNIGNVYLSRGDNENALTYLQQALQLREKLNVPGDIAETLHNAGEVYANIGQFDQAISNYMRALELYRKAGDNVGAGVLSHAMALVFQAQGRYGAAVNAMEDSLKPLRDVGDKSSRMAQFLADLGSALGQAGRMSEARKPLDEAAGVARSLKNDSLQGVILSALGDVAFYDGDRNRAKELYGNALRAVAHSSERGTILTAKMNVAKVTLAEGQPVPAGELRQLAAQAEALGLHDLSVAASVYVAEGMINNKDYARAKESLERVLGSSEKMGLRLQTAKIHYLLGASLRLSGHAADAAAQYSEARRLLDEMKKEAGAEKLLDRADLKSAYEESMRWSTVKS